MEREPDTGVPGPASPQHGKETAMAEPSDKPDGPEGAAAASRHDSNLALALAALERLRYGTITLVVHERRLVQIEVTEKHRF